MTRRDRHAAGGGFRSPWWTRIGVALFLLALALAYPRRQGVADGRTTLTLWVPNGQEESFRVAAEEFQRRNPAFRVAVGSAAVRDAVGDPTRFLLSVVGGTPPDLIFYDRFAVVEWASRGAFTDLAPLLEGDARRDDGVRRENYFEAAWNETVWQGAPYAVPNNFENRLLFYNEDLLLRAGLSRRDGDGRPAARPPETWEELCRKTLEAPARVGADGVVRLAEGGRWPSGARAGDVAVVVKGRRVFRARVAERTDASSLRLDLVRELPPGLRGVPEWATGDAVLKLFDQDSHIVRLTRFDPATGALSEAGFIPLFGNSWLYMFIWANGGELLDADRVRSTYDAPENVAALSFVVDLYDAMGGIEAVGALQSVAASSGLEPFFAGRIALRIDCSEFAASLEMHAPTVNFGAAPPPLPASRRDAGQPPVTAMGGWSYAIPRGVRDAEASWALLRWLCSEEANALMNRSAESLFRARGLPYFPKPHPDRRILAAIMRDYIHGNPHASERLRRAYDTSVAMIPQSRYRPVLPVGQKMWVEQWRATERAIRHEMPPSAALALAREQTQVALDGFLHPPTGPLVPWGWCLAGYVVLAAAALAFVVRRGLAAGGRTGRWWNGYLFTAPWLLGFLVFGGGPILFSLVISFCRYDVLNPAQFIGMDNYVNLWSNPLFWRSLGNTAFMALGVPLGIVCGMALAMLLNSKVRGLGVWRTLYYLPSIVPAMATFMLWLWVFNPSNGLLNDLLRLAGMTDPPHWLGSPDWSKPSLMIMGLWGVGGGMVVWLAGLLNIPESLYEAAAIDGAGKWRMFRHVTLPMMTPYIFFNAVMGLIGTFQIFEAAYIMTDGGPADSTMFYAYLLFNEAFRFLDMGAASAMAWVLFALILLITGAKFLLARYWVYYDN